MAFHLVTRRQVAHLGHLLGTAGLGTEFTKLTAGKTGAEGLPTHNPHNEYLLMGVQLGLIGLVLFVLFLAAIARECRQLDALSRAVVYGYLLAFVLGCFANSLLLNFTEGNLFVLLVGILLVSGRGGQGVHGEGLQTV